MFASLLTVVVSVFSFCLAFLFDSAFAGGVCDVFVGDLVTEAQVYGPDTSLCPGYQVVQGISLNTPSFTIVHEVLFPTPTTPTVSGQNVFGNSINTLITFIQDSGEYDILSSLLVNLEYFSYDEMTCSATTITSATCSLVTGPNFSPIVCNVCGVNPCWLTIYNCSTLDLISDPTYPAFLKVSAQSPIIGPVKLGMITFSINSVPVYAATSLLNVCNTPTPIENFEQKFFSSCAITASPTLTPSPILTPSPTLSPSPTVSQSSSFSSSEPLFFCNSNTSNLRSTNRTTLRTIPYDSFCDMSIRASSPSTQDSVFDIVIPLELLGYTEYAAVTGGTIYLGTGGPDPMVYYGYRDGCDSFRIADRAASFDPGQTVTCDGDSVDRERFDINTFIEGNPLVLMIRVVLPTNSLGLFIGEIELAIEDINATSNVVKINNEKCSNVVTIDTYPCDCAYCENSANTRPFYYAAPFIVDSGGALPEEEPNNFLNFARKDTMHRRAEVSVNETDPYMSFLFDKDQYVYEYPGLFPQAYTAGADISFANNCGVNVHVLPCSGNIQVWLYPRFEFDFSIPVDEDRTDEVFSCFVITELESAGPIPLTSDVDIQLLGTAGFPEQLLSQVIMQTNLKEGQTNISFSRLYGFEIQRPFVTSPYTGIFFRCELGTQLGNRDDKDFYFPLFANSSYCQGSDIPDVPFTGVVPMPTFDNPLHTPLIENVVKSVNFRHMSFMAASTCPTFSMCPEFGISFVQDHQYAPDYVGPAFVFPFQEYGPVDSIIQNYTVTTNIDMSKVLPEIYNGEVPELPLDEIELSWNISYAIDFFGGSFQGFLNTLTFSGPSCALFVCDTSLVDTNFNVQVDILQGFQQAQFTFNVPQNHYTFSNNLTNCLRQFVLITGYHGNLTDIKITYSLSLFVSDPNSTDTILSRVLYHGINFDIRRTPEDFPVSGLFTPRNCTDPQPVICSNCTGSPQIETLFRNTEAELVEQCQIFSQFTPILVAPAENHFQPYVGLQIPFSAIPLIDPIDYLSGVPIQQQLLENRLVQYLFVTFVASEEYFLRNFKKDYVEASYLSYCDNFNGNLRRSFESSDPGPVLCAESLIPNARVVSTTIQMMGEVEGLLVGLYPTTEDTALVIYFKNVYPNETFLVLDIKATIKSVLECDPNVNDYFFQPVYCEDQPANFAWTTQNCSLSVPGECLCQGCGATGVPVGSPGGGASYLISPVIMSGNLTTDPNTVVPPTNPNKKRRSARRATIEESDPFLNEYFNVTATVAPYSGPMLNANSDGLIGETYVVENNCGIYIHVKNCSSNLQVWVNPDPIIGINLNDTYLFPEQIQTISCIVLNDLGSELSVVPLTGNMEILSFSLSAGFISAGLFPVPDSQQVSLINLDTVINATSATTVNIITQGPYGFEIARPLGEGVSGIYVFCEAYYSVAPPYDPDLQNAVMPAFAGKNFCETGAAPTPVPQFSAPPFVTEETVQGRYVVPGMHLFGTPDCPSIPMCPSNKWFFTTPYQYTMDSIGGMYAFPGTPLESVPTPLPAIEQTIVFKLSDIDFVDFFEARKPNQTLSMIFTLGAGARSFLGDLEVRLFVGDSVCGVEACLPTIRSENEIELYNRIQAAVLGVGYGMANDPFRDHVVFLIQFGPECFDRLKTVSDYDKYSIVFDFKANAVVGVPDFSSTIFNQILFGPVRFFLNETLDDFIAPRIPYLFNSIIYTPDQTCARKAPVIAPVCESICQVDKILPGVFSGPGNNISLITPHPNSTSSSYEEVIGIDGSLINNALQELVNSIDYDYDYESASANLIAEAATLVINEGAEFIANITYTGNDPVNVYLLCQFNGPLLRSFLISQDVTLTAPFIPGGYVSTNGSSVQIFASGLCFAFVGDGDSTFEVSLFYGFFASQYNECDKNPEVSTCYSNQILPMKTAGLNSSDTLVGLFSLTIPPGTVIDPLSATFLQDYVGIKVQSTTQTALVLPNYVQPGNDATFRIAPDILGAPSGNLTGTGYSVFTGTSVNNFGNNATVEIIASTRWRFLASPCANESQFSPSQSPSISPTPSESFTESESFTISEFTRTKSQSPTISFTRSMSLEPVFEQCCVRDQPLSNVTNGDVCPVIPVFGCSYLDLPPRLLPGGVYQVRDYVTRQLDQLSGNKSIPLRGGLVVGGIYLTFTENGTNVRFYYLPGTDRVVLKGTAYGRLTNGVFGRTNASECIETPYPSLFPGLFNFSIEMETGLIPIYGEPAGQFAFIVSERSPTPPNQRVPVTISEINKGFLFPATVPSAIIEFGLSDTSTFATAFPDLTSLLLEYRPFQFGVAVSIPDTHIGTYTGIGGIAINCSFPQTVDSIVNFTRNIACLAKAPNGLQYGGFFFQIEAECNDCPATPTPGLCPIHGVTHSHSQSQSMTQSQSQSQTHSVSSTPFPLGPGPFNQTCYSNQQPEIYTKCGVLNSAVFAPDIWEDPMITYKNINYPSNSPFPDFQTGLIEFNTSLIGSGQRFTKFWVPAMPGRTSIFVTIYLWSDNVNASDDYDYGNDEFPFPNTVWNPSELGLYNLPSELVVIVGAGDSPRMQCKHVKNIARCQVKFPQYAGYLYAGIASSPRTNMTISVGFVYVQMLMINGLGFDNTVAPFDPVIAPPNCVMLNISVGTPHNPACNLAWGAAIPTLGSDAYSYTIASTVTSILVMGGVSTAAVFGMFWSYTKRTGLAEGGEARISLTELNAALAKKDRQANESKRNTEDIDNHSVNVFQNKTEKDDEDDDDDDDDDGEVVELSAYGSTQ